MNSRLLVTAALGLAVTVLSGPAFADTYVLNEGAGFTSGDLMGSITNTTPPLSLGSVYIGPLVMNVTDQTTSVTFPQTVYCTDIFNEFFGGDKYSLSATSLATQIGGANAATKVGQINALLNFAPVSDKASGAAVQAAIWEIMNEPSMISGYSLTAGNFQASVSSDVAAFTADVTADFANITGANPAWKPVAGDSVWEYVPIGGTNQDFSYVGLGGGTTTSAPEPASLTVLGLGMLGLAAVRRRRTPHR